LALIAQLAVITGAPDSIAAPGSFNYADGANVDSAVFGDHTPTINDNVLSDANGWEMTFTDATTPFTGLSLVSSTLRLARPIASRTVP
jgi:hypothetical protein